MNKRERVMAVINGKTPDKIPSGFWLHFAGGVAYGPAAVEAHLEFFEKSGTDICKVMNENLIPKDPNLNNACDWSNLKPIDENSEFLKRQIELVKNVVEAVDGGAVVLATIHGVVASASHIIGGGSIYDTDRDILVRHLRENPHGMRNGFEVITRTLEYLVKEVLAAGADGIYYAALGGEKTMYTDQEFAEFVRPYDIRIMEAAKNRKCFNVLHMCKDSLNLERYKGYPGDVVNWVSMKTIFHW